MDYLTNLYKAKAEQLQERYNFLQEQLKMLVEKRNESRAADAGKPAEAWGGGGEQARKNSLEKLHNKFKNLTDEQFEGWAKQSGVDEESVNILRASRKAGKFSFDTGSPQPQPQPKTQQGQSQQTSTASEQPRRTSSTQQPPRTEPSGTSSSSGTQQSSSTYERATDPYADYNAAARKKAEQRQAEQAAAKEAREAKGPKSSAPEAKATSGEIKPTETKAVSTATKAPMKSKIGGGVANLAGFFGGDYLTRKALEAAGVENETVKDIGGALGGGVAGEFAGAGTAAALGGAAMPATAAGLAALAGTGLAVGAVGYGAAKAGEAISNIEVNKKGETVADVGGKFMYDYIPQVKVISNILQGNKPFAGSGDLNEKPKGVAGGDKALMAKQEAEEKAEEAKKQSPEYKAMQSDEVAKRAAKLRQKRAEQRQGSTPEVGSVA